MQDFNPGLVILGTATEQREALINALCDRFYTNEPARLASNGLSTEFIYFPSDLNPGRKEYLNRKIRDVTDYACAFFDVEEINAFMKMPKREPYYYQALGLYLYLADEMSRLHPETTLLTEMRKANVTADANNDTSRRELYKRAMYMLKSLGMYESHGKVITDWFRTGVYEIEGHSHASTYDGISNGAYVRLARDISSLRIALPLNLSISYALGNKEKISGMTAKEAYDYTNSLTHLYKTGWVDARIGSAIESGDRQRRERIRDALGDRYREEWKGRPHPRREPTLAKAIFSRLPTDVLELFYREGYNCAYSDDVDISKCYPKEPLPGISDDDHKIFSSDQGHRQQRYRTLFVSNGKRESKRDLPLRREVTLTQTIMHEIMHMVISNLTQAQLDELKRKAEAVHDEVKELQEHHTLPRNLTKKLKSLSYFSPKDVLDYEAFPYSGYNAYARQEEVICNVAGLMYSEFPYPPPPGLPNPYDDLPSLDALARQIQESIKIAVGVSRNTYSHVLMPPALCRQL